MAVPVRACVSVRCLLPLGRKIMGEGNHLPATTAVSHPKGRWMWLFGGTAFAVIACGLLMQYVRSTATKAASDPPAGVAGVSSKSANKPEVLAKVAGESITYDAVADEAVKRHGREVLDDLIHRLIIQQACEKHKISVSEQEISEQIEQIAKRYNLDVAQWLQMLQAERNISPIQYRQSVIFPMIALKKLVGEEVEITDKEMKEAFVRNYGPRVKARMIMFNNQRHAQEGWDLLDKNPDDFEKLAAKLSVDPSSRALGGQIPPIARFNGNDTFEREAFKLKTGDISGVIEVRPSTFVILKCEGRTDPVVTNIDDEGIRDTLYTDLKESKIQAAVAEKFNQIKKQTIVDNYLTQTSNRPERTANARSGDQGIQPAAGTRPPKGPGNSASAPSKANRN